MTASPLPPTASASPAPRSDLACPACMGTIVGNATELSCTACGARYVIRDGIADFRSSRHDYYFNPVPREEMRALTDKARHQPWATTVQTFLEKVGHNPEWLDDLVVDARYAWKLLLRLPQDARVLDLGCGLGNLAKNVAPLAGRFDAIDLTFERLQFARVRFERAGGLDNITLFAGGEGRHLPFPDNSFDCVTLSGVLEWVAADSAWASGDTKLKRAFAAFSSFFGSSNPRKTQIRFLREIGRILKPDGQVFIAIENRLSYRYFGKQRDHHSGLWFGSLLPRFLANVYSMLVAHHPYRTYTYSLGGFRRLLKAAGFPRMECCGLTPGYTELAELIPFRTHDARWRPVKPDGRERIKRGRHFVPAYGFVGTKAVPDRPSLAERLAASMESQLTAEPGTMRFKRFRVTETDKGIIDAEVEGRQVVVKLSFNATAEASAARNYQVLQQASEWPALRQHVPRAIATGDIQGLRYYAEDRVAGHALRDERAVHGAAAWFDPVSDLLEALNPDLQNREAETFSGEVFKEQVANPLGQVKDVIEGPLAIDLARFFEEHFDSMRMRLGVVHGDFSDANIFVHGTRVVALIDWDDSTSRGIPALDALNFVDAIHRRRNPDASTDTAMSRLSRWERLTDTEQAFLVKSYGRCAIEPSCHRALAALYWLRRIAHQLDGRLVYDRPGIEAQIVRVFDRLLHEADAA
ncbi:MAG TPA: methyltransferase domain-containing protein [Rhodanobacteraceae bacterium]|nr:methyltransferase domain-containing protein [Rhodanobacteraceae bacterium]